MQILAISSSPIHNHITQHTHTDLFHSTFEFGLDTFYLLFIYENRNPMDMNTICRPCLLLIFGEKGLWASKWSLLIN